DDAGNVFSARAEAALVVPAVEQLLNASASANVQGADALGAIYFVCGERKEIDAKHIYIDRDFAGGLYCVCVEANISFSGDSPDFSERLNRAELVVGVHDADQNGLRANCGANGGRIHKTTAVHRKIGNGDALLFESLTGVENRFVFDGSG